MKVPLSWLRDYVDFELSAAELADRLSFSGSEVESIETIGADYDGVVVGEILAVEPHPNADKLSICRATNGAAELRIVCGAPNAAPGLKVPLAQVGAVLPGGMQIKRAKIRGEQSEGMLCAEDELAISDDHTGLMVLGAELAAGTPFAEVMGPPETVLDIEITPNRPDCLSIIGLAREVAALLGTTVKWPDIELPEAGPPVTDRARVDVEDSDACPRYTARVLSGIRIGPSPLWMQRRLTHCGLRPINNVVDITNYVLLECGQPLHAFDQALLEEGRIVVRRAAPGEQMATLDGLDRAITSEMLLIADAARPVALAGIMGGAGSEIQPDTETVLLESAFFDPVRVRKTAKALELATESSYRFERGVDVGLVEWASRRAAGLMAAHAGAVAAPGVIDVFPGGMPERTVPCRYDKVRALTGLDIPDSRVDAVFESLLLAVQDRKEGACTVRIPSFRVDLTREVDLIEEVARIHGLENIPTGPPKGRLVPGATDLPTRAATACRAALVGLGLNEIMNYSFLSARLLDLFDRADADTRIVLPNPTSADHAVLRNTLLPQLVETLGRNHARQAGQGAVFEMGRVFWKDAECASHEEDRLTAGLMGPVGRAGLEKRVATSDEQAFAWLRGVLERLCSALNTAAPTLTAGARAFYEQGRAADVLLDGVPCGSAGLLSSAVRKEWRILEPVAVMELRLAPLLAHVFEARQFVAVNPYPAVIRDLALVVDAGLRHEQIAAVIEQNAPENLEIFELFDVFSGKGVVPPGKKSMAYSFRYRAPNRTLTDEEANCYHDAVKSAVKKALKVEIREG